MQPLKTIVSPSCSSTSGWSPVAERSMIFRRRCANAVPPADQEPRPSGPRFAMVSAIRSTASRSGEPAKLISPANPHTSIPRRLRCRARTVGSSADRSSGRVAHSMRRTGWWLLPPVCACRLTSLVSAVATSITVQRSSCISHWARLTTRRSQSGRSLPFRLSSPRRSGGPRCCRPSRTRCAAG